MKILFLIRSLDIGGAERQLVILAASLKQRGYSVKVIVFYKGGVLENELRKAAVPVISLNKKRRWDILEFLYRLIKIINNEKPDIVHSYLTVANLLTVFLKCCFPALKIVWGLRASNMDLKQYDRLSRVAGWCEAKFSKCPKGIIVNSQAGFEFAKLKGYAIEHMQVISNGIDTERFLPDVEKRATQRTVWGIKPSEILIGLVGRLDPMKGHPVFLEAARHLVKDHPHFRFVCVGSGSKMYGQQLKNLSHAKLLEEKLFWVDSIEDVQSIYNALDILCLPSAFGEGFSNVVGEAMSCGCPAIVSDVGDSARIVGDMGCVVPPKDSFALAEACVSLLRHRPDAHKVRTQIVVNFSVAVMVDRAEVLLIKIK